MNRHGEILFTWENDILIVQVIGAFNEQGIEYYVPLMRKYILNRAVDKWSRLELWDDEALGCPQTLALVKSVYEWYELNGCILSAVVVSNSIQAQVIRGMLKSDAKTFLVKTEAIEWLNTHNRVARGL